MAVVTNNAAVAAGNGLGPTPYICSVATGTVTVEDACAEIQNEGGVRTSQFSSRFIFPHVGQSLAKSKLWRHVKHTEIDI